MENKADFIKIRSKGENKMMRFEVQYYPPGSSNICKIIVEATDVEMAAQIVMNMFQIPRNKIYSVCFA